MSILKQAQTGVPVPDLCRQFGMSSATFYKWHSKYGGMDAPLISRLKALESESNRLKRLVADERLNCEILREVIEKKL